PRAAAHCNCLIRCQHYDYEYAVYLPQRSARHQPPLHSFPTRRSSDLKKALTPGGLVSAGIRWRLLRHLALGVETAFVTGTTTNADRKSTRLNSSHGSISYAVFCLKK